MTEEEKSHKTPGPRRTPLERELDRAKMMRWLRRGYTQSMVAEKLGVVQSQIAYDYKKVMTEVIAGRNGNMEALIDMKLEELAEVKKEAWEAWEKSKLRAEKYVEENSDRGNKTTLTTEGRLPDNQYLRTVLECIQAERELQGLDKAKKVDVNANVINWDVLAQGIPDGPVPDLIEETIRHAMNVKPIDVLDHVPTTNGVNGIHSDSNSEENGISDVDGEGKESENGGEDVIE